MPVGSVSYKDYRGQLIEESCEAVLFKAANDPFFPWPFEVVSLLVNPDPRPVDGYSITTLEQQCVRCVVLQAREDYTLNLNKAWSRFRGTIGHSLMEQRPAPDTINEVRFFTTIEGRSVHGRVDRIKLHPATQEFTVIDWKFPKQVPRWDKVWNDHEAQLNCYRYLVNHMEKTDPSGVTPYSPNEYTQLRDWTCRSVGVVYMDGEGVKPLEVRRAYDVPTKAGAKSATKKEKRVYVWSDEEVLAYLIPRIERLEAAFEQYDTDGTLPEYPAGFDAFAQGSLHTYSDVVHTCVTRWREGR